MNNEDDGKFILGNGLSAKIFAFYNREYQIIGKDTTMAGNKIAKNLIFLHDCHYNRKFIIELKRISGKEILMKEKNIPVEIFRNNSYEKEILEEEKKEIIKQKLETSDGEKLNFINKTFEDRLKLSESENGNLKTLEVDYKQIMEVLDGIIKSQIIDASLIKNIDIENKKIITEMNSYNYEVCISTINLRDFLFLSNKTIETEKLESLDTTITQGTEKEFLIPEISSQDAIIYFPQKNFRFGKIVKRNGICYAEQTGNFKEENSVIIKSARIVRRNLNNNYEGVVFLGRYAEWNPDIRIQDIVRKSSEKIAMQRVWTDQKKFSCNFFDMQEDISLIQNNVKNVSLLMIDEVFSLLGKINWKKHNKEKKLNIDEIKEEWIDCFKYLLTIGIEFGITYEDFLDAYWLKSLKLERKYNVNGTKKM